MKVHFVYTEEFVVTQSVIITFRLKCGRAIALAALPLPE